MTEPETNSALHPALAHTSPTPTKVLLARLWREAVKPYGGSFILALLAMVAVAATTAALAYLMDPVVNQVFVEQNADLLWPVGGAVFAAFCIKGIAAYVQSVLMIGAGQRILKDMQVRLFRHLLTLDLKSFRILKTGPLITRFTTDIVMMRQAVSTALAGVGRDSLSVVFLIGVMFYQDWRLAAVAFFVFPLAVFPITRLGRRLRRVTTDTQTGTGSLVAMISQSLNGIRLIKAFGMEEAESQRMERQADTVFKTIVSAERTKAIASPLMETLGGVAVTVVIVYGGWRVIDGGMTPGAFFSFITALLMAYRPMKALANLNAQLQEGLAGADRLFAVLDQQPAITDIPNAKPLAVSGGAIRFTDVSFSYGPERPALDGITLDIPAGAVVALVGRSGAGKSTVFNLIPRFDDPDAGSVTIDGQDLRTVTVGSIRDAVALVTQDVLLFDDTIEENIRFGRPGASNAEVKAAAKAAAAHDFITALPQGYTTPVGEHGLSLSGGQRQRIALARALLKDAPILLLDEATSSLDPESEAEIKNALKAAAKGRTVVIIAHRLSTVEAAEHIVVMDGGRIVEQGRHEDLISKGGVYAQVYASDFSVAAQ